VAAVCSHLLDFAIGGLLLVVALVLAGVPVSAGVWAIAPLALLTTLASVAAGSFLSAVNVRYRDVRYALPFLVQLWLFATPIAYSADLVPSEVRWALALNPMTGIIEGFRSALLGTQIPDLATLAASVALVLVGSALGLAYFRSAERTFADVI
jgi:lipopolysaccharide transport system permease protein